MHSPAQTRRSSEPGPLGIRGIESETDRFPLGIVGDNSSPDYLRPMDAEMERYLAETREDILEAQFHTGRITDR